MSNDDFCLLLFTWIFCFLLFIGPLLIQDIYYLISRPEFFWTILEPTAKTYFQIELYLLIILFIMSTISIVIILSDQESNCFLIIFNSIIGGISIYLSVLYIFIMISGNYKVSTDTNKYFDSFMNKSTEIDLLKIRRVFSINFPNSTFIKQIFFDLIEEHSIQPLILRIIMIAFAYMAYTGFLFFPIYFCVQI